ATCDADNLFDYQSILTSTHTNCLIQFVKERLAKSFSSQPRRAFYALLICCQAFILKFFPRNSFSFNRLTRCDLSQREANHTALQSAVNRLVEVIFRSCFFQNTFNFNNLLLASLRSTLRGGE
ncbi:hypothetical protein ACFY9K_19005, partial [Pseudomonas sichuanensis]